MSEAAAKPCERTPLYGVGDTPRLNENALQRGILFSMGGYDPVQVMEVKKVNGEWLYKVMGIWTVDKKEKNDVPEGCLSPWI